MLGGLGRIVVDKINWLVAHGYEVSLCNIERLDVKPAYNIDPRVKLIRGDISTEPGNALTALKGVLKAISRVKEVINIEKPDVIVNAHCPLITWILPFVYHEIPKVVEIHQSRQGLEVFDRWALNGFSRWLHRWSIRWIYSKYDKFVVLTTGDQKAWNCKNSIVIPNFSNYSENKNVPTYIANNPNGNQIIMLARLVPQKRIDLMIDVWAKVAKEFPDWHVKVLGGEEYGSPYASQLRNKIASLGIGSSFFMLGAVPDVTSELESSQLLCLTSEYEGFGIVLIEAMLKGIPVMAFEYVGVHDVINDGECGYIVPFGNVDAYAEKLKSLISSAEKRMEFSDHGLEFVKKFDKSKVMEMWVELFTSLRVTQ